MKKKIVAYVRISHEEQQKEFEKNSNSIEYQIRIIDNYPASFCPIDTDLGFIATNLDKIAIAYLYSPISS